MPYFVLKFFVDKATGKTDVVRLICVIYTHILTDESRTKIDNLVEQNPNDEVKKHFEEYKRIMDNCVNEKSTDPIKFINTHKKLINEIIAKIETDKYKPIKIPIEIPEELTKENFEEFKTHVNANVANIIESFITPVEPPNPLKSARELLEKGKKGDIEGAMGLFMKPNITVRAGGGKRNLKKSKKIKKINKTRTNKNNKNKSKRYWY
jgi:hypothetical protein